VGSDKRELSEVRSQRRRSSSGELEPQHRFCPTASREVRSSSILVFPPVPGQLIARSSTILAEQGFSAFHGDKTGSNLIGDTSFSIREKRHYLRAFVVDHIRATRSIDRASHRPTRSLIRIAASYGARI